LIERSLSRSKVWAGVSLFLLILAFAGFLWVPSANLSYSSGLVAKIQVLDRHGREVKVPFRGEVFDLFRFDEVPIELVELILLAEDQNFFQHWGVDSLALARASFNNIRYGKVVSGASTVTQQVYRLKNQVPRTILGKVKTLLGALRLEGRYSKKDILEFYLNSIPFGKNIRGLRMAADYLFSKKLRELSVAEMAVLAVLPRAPSFLMKGSSRGKLTELRNSLLMRYSKVHASKFSSEKLSLSLKEDLSSYQVSNSYSAPHFLKWILSLESKDRYLENGVLQTTIDLDIQRELKSILRNQVNTLKKFGVSKAAAIVVDNRTGDILAYAGSQDYFSEQGGQYDSVQMLRQPGSAVKPFTYLLGLENGMNLTDIIPDIPQQFRSGAGTFVPRNYSKNFSGPRLLMDSLANSLNIPALYLADKIGVEKVYDFYQELGFNLAHPSDHYGVGITLGNGEQSLFGLTQAYTLFSNEGKMVSLKPFLKKEVLKKKAASKNNSWLIQYALDNDVSRRSSFGQHNIFDLKYSLAVKTGTSTLFRDNWSFGFNQKYTIGVWVGNMDQRPMHNISGITGAGPILVKISDFLVQDSFVGMKPMPDDVENVEICQLSGKLASTHCNHKVVVPVVTKGFSDSTCDVHREESVLGCFKENVVSRVKVYELPEIYREWMALSPYSQVKDQLADTCMRKDFRILNIKENKGLRVAINKPLSGSLYAIDPNIPLKYQVLRFESLAEGDYDYLQWKVNGVIQKGRDNSLKFMMNKGKKELEVSLIKDGVSVLSDKVTFTIL
jgi:penicillin-binding protein 1C